MNLQAYGGRKFIAFIVVLFLAYIALQARKLTGAEFVDLVKWGLGILATGNVVQKFIPAVQETVAKHMQVKVIVPETRTE